MRHISRVSFLVGLLLLCASPRAGIAQSAFIDLPKASGLSKFVLGEDRKPVQLGVPSRSDRGEVPEPTVVVLPQSGAEHDGPPPSEKSQDDEPSQRTADNQSSQPDSSAPQQSGSDPSSVVGSPEETPDEQDSSGSDAGSCGADCDD
jgi:hypothetical protein